MDIFENFGHGHIIFKNSGIKSQDKNLMPRKSWQVNNKICTRNKPLQVNVDTFFFI